MKKCPHCKAEIEENARFCLYCMTSLDEKQTVLPPKKRWVLLNTAAAILLWLILILLCCVGGGKLRGVPHGKLQNLPPDEGEMHTIYRPSLEITDAEQEKLSTEPQITEAATTDPPVQPKPTEQTKPAGCSHQYQLTTTRMPSCTTEGINTYTCSRCGDSYQNTLSATGHSYQAPTCLLPQVCTVCSATGTAALGHSYQNGSCIRCGKADPSDPRMVYEYREAQANDPLIYGTWDPETDIIITGIKQTAEDGIYEVPSYIGGKRVVGIQSFAFSGADARKVTLPDTVFYVGSDAFSGCFNLEALYICGDALFLSRSAFVFTATRNCDLTIYCDAHCMVKDDLKGECYLKDIVRVYGAQYHQWNG